MYRARRFAVMLAVAATGLAGAGHAWASRGDDDQAPAPDLAVEVPRLVEQIGWQGNDGDQDVGRLIAIGAPAVSALLAAADPSRDPNPHRRKLAAAALADLPDDRSTPAILRLLATDAARASLDLDEAEEVAFLCGVASYLGDHRALPALITILRHQPELSRVAAAAIAQVASNDFAPAPRWGALFAGTPEGSARGPTPGPKPAAASTAIQLPFVPIP